MIKAPKFWFYKKPFYLSTLLIPFTYLWIIGSYLKKIFTKKHKAKVPVICIGSPVIGGSGKTPVAIYISKILKQLDLNPHIISKGYGGNFENTKLVDEDDSFETVGDEPKLLSKFFPTWVSRKRFDAAEFAVKKNANILVLDDGLQSLSLKKDLSILVVDAEQLFGNEKIFPAGPLRENIEESINKTDFSILINAKNKRYKLTNKTFYGNFFLKTRYDLKDKKLIAFSGLGFNLKFFNQLKENGYKIEKTVEYPDHHQYTTEDCFELLELANNHDAFLITTEKDHIRIPKNFQKSIHFIEGYITIEEEQILKELILSKIKL